jgi:hypothetical protein
VVRTGLHALVGRLLVPGHPTPSITIVSNRVSKASSRQPDPLLAKHRRGPGPQLLAQLLRLSTIARGWVVRSGCCTSLLYSARPQPRGHHQLKICRSSADDHPLFRIKDDSPELTMLVSVPA